MIIVYDKYDIVLWNTWDGN